MSTPLIEYHCRFFMTIMMMITTAAAPTTIMISNRVLSPPTGGGVVDPVVVAGAVYVYPSIEEKALQYPSVSFAPILYCTLVSDANGPSVME